MLNFEEIKKLKLNVHVELQHKKFEGGQENLVDDIIYKLTPKSVSDMIFKWIVTVGKL